MSTVTGQRNTGNVATVQRYIDIAPEIVRLEPEAAPLTVISRRIREGGNTKLAGDPEFSWVESERDARFDAINKAEGYASGATELVVDTEDIFAPGQIIIVPRTGEELYVESKPGSSKIKVSRGFSGTTAAALVDNDPLFVIGEVSEEGARSPEARSQGPTKKTNLTEITRTTIEASGTWMSSQNQTSPHDWVYQHQERNREHLIGLETKALFNSKGETTGPNGKKLRTSGGLLSFYTSNRQDAGGTLTEAEFEEWVRTICRYGSKKTAFVSPLVLSVINKFAVSKLQVIQADMDTTYGLNITKYMSAHGEIALVKHNLLEGAVWGGYAIAVDFEKAPPKWRPLGGGPGGSRETKLLPNRQENDRDGQKDEILTEGGYEFPQPKTGGVLTGVTG